MLRILLKVLWADDASAKVKEENKKVGLQR